MGIYARESSLVVSSQLKSIMGERTWHSLYDQQVEKKFTHNCQDGNGNERLARVEHFLQTVHVPGGSNFLCFGDQVFCAKRNQNNQFILSDW